MLGYFGAACVLGIAAIGSAIGIGIAGQAAIGAWKRCYMNNKPAPFILTVLQVHRLHRQFTASFLCRQ